MRNNVIEVLDNAARAYEELIAAGDRVRLTPDEVRLIAEALNGCREVRRLSYR